MASGSYAKKPAPQAPLEIPSKIPARATRHLIDTTIEDLDEPETIPTRRTNSKALQVRRTDTKDIQTEPTNKPLSIDRPRERENGSGDLNKKSSLTNRLSERENGVGELNKKPLATFRTTRIVVEEYQPHPLRKHKPWLTLLILGTIMAVIFCGVLLSASMSQRPGGPQLINYFGGKVYDVQVGGNLAGTWQSNQPLPPKVPIPIHTGPYSVLGKPTITADFINRVLASYNSPAAGKGQALYDLGVQYGVDPAFALAFFLHESTFGKYGEAHASLSLGNIRCIPNYRCQDNFAWFNTWEDGFKAWYELIRNLYVAQWGLTTVDDIIPRYAPASDHNDEAAYINSLKHSLDTWHAGLLTP